MASHQKQLGCVLVIADEHAIIRPLEQHLKRAGFRVLGPVRSAREGLLALDRWSPQAVVLDPSIKGGLPAEFAQELCQRGIPFHACCGNLLARAVPVHPNTNLLAPLWVEEVLNVLLTWSRSGQLAWRQSGQPLRQEVNAA